MRGLRGRGLARVAPELRVSLRERNVNLQLGLGLGYGYVIRLRVRRQPLPLSHEGGRAPLLCSLLGQNRLCFWPSNYAKSQAHADA